MKAPKTAVTKASMRVMMMVAKTGFREVHLRIARTVVTTDLEKVPRTGLRMVGLMVVISAMMDFEKILRKEERKKGSEEGRADGSDKGSDGGCGRRF